MKSVQTKIKGPVKNENLKNLKPFNGKADRMGKAASQPLSQKLEKPTAEISENAKVLNSAPPEMLREKHRTPLLQIRQ